MCYCLIITHGMRPFYTDQQKEWNNLVPFVKTLVKMSAINLIAVFGPEEIP